LLQIGTHSRSCLEELIDDDANADEWRETESKASDVTSERERTIADALSVVMSHAPMKCMQPANWRFARHSAGVATTRLLLQGRRFRICNNPALSEFRILHSALRGFWMLRHRVSDQRHHARRGRPQVAAEGRDLSHG